MRAATESQDFPPKSARKVSPAMAIRKLAELTDDLKPGCRLLGLDLGEKTIGLALSDGTWMIATPMTTLKRGKFTKDAGILLDLIAEHDIGGLVIGLPINMNGSEGPKCQSARQFAENMQTKKNIPIAFWDERLSTVAVTRTMIEADLSRAKQKDAVDKMAAAYILQGALDFLRNQAAG
jgi:putative Holliday junction resolvase